MSDNFIGEIRIFAGDFAIRNWAFCNGQIMPISQNTALFAILGTYYGGNGQSNFALPNLQGCAPLCQGQGPGLSDHMIGDTGGQAGVTLSPYEMPAHLHLLAGTSAPATSYNPTSNLLATSAKRPYTSATPGNADMHSQTLSPAGNSQPHNNLPPYLALNFIIALTGIWPSHP